MGDEDDQDLHAPTSALNLKEPGSHDEAGDASARTDGDIELGRRRAEGDHEFTDLNLVLDSLHVENTALKERVQAQESEIDFLKREKLQEMESLKRIHEDGVKELELAFEQERHELTQERRDIINLATSANQEITLLRAENASLRQENASSLYCPRKFKFGFWSH